MSVIELSPGVTAPKSQRSRVEGAVMIAFAVLLCILCLFVIYPSATVLHYPALADYADVLTRSRTFTAMRNSAVITVLSTTSATAIGFVFAFVVTRRDIPGRRLFRAVGMLPLFAPPFMVAFA